MDLPLGFDKTNYGKVCKLKKFLYGLKQFPRAQFGRFSQVVPRYGYKQAQTNHTLFIKHSEKGIIALIMYVDDIILTGNNEEEMERLKKNLVTEFEIKDLERLRYFLRMEVMRNNNRIAMSQRKYILELLKETSLLGYQPAEMPVDPNSKMVKCDDRTPMDKG